MREQARGCSRREHDRGRSIATVAHRMHACFGMYESCVCGLACIYVCSMCACMHARTYVCTHVCAQTRLVSSSIGNCIVVQSCVMLIWNANCPPYFCFRMIGLGVWRSSGSIEPIDMLQKSPQPSPSPAEWVAWRGTYRIGQCGMPRAIPGGRSIVSSRVTLGLCANFWGRSIASG